MTLIWFIYLVASHRNQSLSKVVDRCSCWARPHVLVTGWNARVNISGVLCPALQTRRSEGSSCEASKNIWCLQKVMFHPGPLLLTFGADPQHSSWLYVLLIQANSSAQADPFGNCGWCSHTQAASHLSGWQTSCRSARWLQSAILIPSPPTWN